LARLPDVSVASIVEGFAEVESVPVLLRRLGVEPATPFRVHRNLVVKPGELERTLRLATRARADVTAVLVLLDADDDCPAQLAPVLLDRARAVTNLPVSVVLAVREIEAWFLGGIESLRGSRGISADAAWEGDPERPRGAKGRVEAMMGGRGYLGPVDQPALMAKLDIDAARLRCPSLDKLLRDLEGFGLVG
jgi:hypothetical protein